MRGPMIPLPEAPGEIGCFARHLVQFFSGGTQRKMTFQMLTWAKPGGGKANAFMGISIGGCLVCTWHGRLTLAGWPLDLFGVVANVSQTGCM